MQWGELEVVRFLIDKRASVAVKDHTGWTPVLLAANRDDTSMLDLILSKGGKLDDYRAGWGPLNYATHHGKEKMVRHLLDQGIDPNQKHGLRKGRMHLPVHSASFMGHLEILKILLKAGADRTLKDGEGNTARDFAFQQKKERDKMREMMAGIDLSEYGAETDSPFEKPWEEIIELLEKGH